MPGLTARDFDIDQLGRVAPRKPPAPARFLAPAEPVLFGPICITPGCADARAATSGHECDRYCAVCCRYHAHLGDHTCERARALASHGRARRRRAGSTDPADQIVVRRLKCAGCGEMFEQTGGGAPRTRCDVCIAARKAYVRPTTGTCEVCGAAFPHKRAGPLKTRCPAHPKRRTAPAPGARAARPCDGCGALVPQPPRGRFVRHCDACCTPWALAQRLAKRILRGRAAPASPDSAAWDALQRIPSPGDRTAPAPEDAHRAPGQGA